MAWSREDQRAYQKRWYEANRDRILEQARIRRAQPEEIAKRREYERAYRARANYRDYHRNYYAANRDKILLKKKQEYDTRRGWERNLLKRHGMRPEDWAAFWQAHGDRCYLCGDAVTPESAVIDHDHSCCGIDHTCRLCRRGLACGTCNTAIGMAREDPAKLRRMADALEAAQCAVEERKVLMGTQLRLGGEIADG